MRGVLSVSELMAGLEIGELLAVVAGEGERSIESVRLAEDISELADAPAGAVVLLSASASTQAASYRFDIALRLAATTGVAAVVVTVADAVDLSTTARAIAQRAGLTVLRVRRPVDLAELAIIISREIAGGAELELARATAVMSALERAELDRAGPDELLAAASHALGLELFAHDPGEPHDLDTVPASCLVIVDGRLERVIGVDSAVAALPAVSLALALTASALGRAVSRARRAEEGPTRSREELLIDLLHVSERDIDVTLRRARTLGVPIDGWHVAAVLEFDNLLDVAGADEARMFELGQTLARTVIETVRAAGGTWERVRIGQSLVLVRMERTDPGARVGTQVFAVLDRALQRLLARVPTLAVYCGVGSSHSALAGLRASLAEARAAVAAARTANRTNQVVGFDTVGLRRMLIEWYASDTAREAIETVLAPLDRLGPRRSAEAVRTLGAYLDHQGSLSKAAEELHLHRNSVAYRIRRIFDALDVHPDDPDQRLILQLACRARTLLS